MNHAILHIDGDAFFASCEQSRNPALRGKPVICGKERGIAASMSYEAKERGVTRAMPWFEIKKLCPDAVYLPSDYETYSLLSERLYAIVRRFTDQVEEYGIDECFIDLTGWDKAWGLSYVELAEKIKTTLDQELGFTFSCGLAETKTLAKVASKWKKPSGLTVIETKDRFAFLDNWPVAKIWGIGPAGTAFLEKYNIKTTGQFARTNEWWVKGARARPFYDTWRELNGTTIIPFFGPHESYQSMQKFKTFTPPSSEVNFVFAQLCKNIENACIKARRYNLFTDDIYIVLRTQDFKHQFVEVKLMRPTNLPGEMIRQVRPYFFKLYKPKILYRATGISLINLRAEGKQMDIFGEELKQRKITEVYKSADVLSTKYGKHVIFLGTSFLAHKFGAHLTERGDVPERQRQLLFGETKRRRLNLPMLFAKV